MQRGKHEFYVFTIFILSVLLLVCVRQLHARQNASTLGLDKQSLIGVRKFYLKINYDDKASADGLLKANVQTDVELKLRQTGIVIATAENFKAQEDTFTPELDVDVDLLKADDNVTYIYTERVEVRQVCFLARTKDIVGVYSTWQHGHFGTVGKNRLAVIRDSAKDDVDVFCNDYLTANPKK